MLADTPSTRKWAKTNSRMGPGFSRRMLLGTFLTSRRMQCEQRREPANIVPLLVGRDRYEERVVPRPPPGDTEPATAGPSSPLRSRRRQLLRPSRFFASLLTASRSTTGTGPAPGGGALH